MRSKKNKKKLIIAVILGIIATFSLFNSMNSQKAAMNKQQAIINKLNKKVQEQSQNPFKQPEEKKENPKAVVAATDIKVGDTFVLETLDLKEFAKDELPDNYFKTKAMVVGKKAGRNIATGGLITPIEIQTMDVNTIDIPNDTRAITIPVEKFKGLASYIKIGSMVDILKVSNPPEFIAQSIKVVAFELAPTATAVRDKSKLDITAKNASAITFLVPIDLVSSLIDAMFTGQLQIITRNNNDEKILITEAELPPPPSGEIASLPDIPAPSTVKNLPEPKMPKPDPRKIELIKASSVSSIKIESDDLQVNSRENEDSLSDEKLRELLDMVN